MINPLISCFLDYLNISYTDDITQAVCEYNDKDISVKISLYSIQDRSNSLSPNKEIKEVSLSNFCDAVSFFTGYEVHPGTAKDSIFHVLLEPVHKKVKFFRIFLPSWKAQIDYEDIPQNIDFSLNVEKQIRGMFEIIG